MSATVSVSFSFNINNISEPQIIQHQFADFSFTIQYQPSSSHIMSSPPATSAITVSTGGQYYSIVFYITSAGTINYLYAPDNQYNQEYSVGKITHDKKYVYVSKGTAGLTAVSLSNSTQVGCI